MTDTENSDLVLGLVAPIGADRDLAYRLLSDCLELHGYTCVRIKLSKIIEEVSNETIVTTPTECRISSLMDAGNKLRKETSDSVLGFLAAKTIKDSREALKQQAVEKCAFVSIL